MLNPALIERDSPAAVLGERLSITNPVANTPWASERSERWLLNSAETQTASWQGDVSPDALIGLRAREAVLDQGRVSLFLYRFAERGFDRVLSARDPITVHVDARGNALLFEGLYRVVAAARFGVPAVPVVVNYFGGAELKATSWQPRVGDPRQGSTQPFELLIPNLVAWGDASQLSLQDGQAMATWPQPFTNSLFNVPQQATGASQPLYKAQIRNGLGAVLFNGTSSAMSVSGAGNVTFFQRPYAMFCVAQYLGTNDNGLHWIMSAGNIDSEITLALNTPFNVFGISGSSNDDEQVGPPMDNAPHVFVGLADDSLSQRFYADGVLQGSQTLTAGIAGTLLQIGVRGVSRFWNGYIFEWGVITGKVTPALVKGLTRDLGKKWAIPIPLP